MHKAAENLFGADLWNKFEVYSRLKDLGEDKAAGEFWDANAELGYYMDFKEQELPLIDEKVSQFGRLIPEARPPIYRGEDQEQVTPNSYNPDSNEAWINSQVTAFSQAYTDYSGRRPDLMTAIRKQADEFWPQTRSQADRYYGLVEKDPTAAAKLVSGNAYLEARITWEYEQLVRLELAQSGEFLLAAQGGEQIDQQSPEVQMAPHMQRLIQDLQQAGEPLPQFILDYLNQ